MRRFTATVVWWVLWVATAAAADSGSRVYFTGDFESGRVQSREDTHDGFFIKTLPNPQAGVNQIVIAKGGAAPDSGLDTRVVSSEKVGSEIVKPRRGNYFARTAVYYNKDYSRFNGNSGKNKPRSNLGVTGHEVDYDVEGYLGFSIYVPSNFENELGKKGDQGKTMLLTVVAPPAETFYNLSVWVPSNKSEAHWFIQVNINDKSVTEGSGGHMERIDIGPVQPDKGKWTDFVIRFRSNPFSATTNPARKGIASAKDRTFLGNKGILQLWKAEGPTDSLGNRRMALKVNKLNTPVGLVPHASSKMKQSFRIYKHGWHIQPTSVKGPVWFGFDEIRFGLVAKNGTGYADVNPSNLGCTDRCPDGSSSKDHSPPNPPEDLIVVQE